MEMTCARLGAQWPGQTRESSCILQFTITDDTKIVRASCNCVYIFMQTNICSRNILSKSLQRTNIRTFGIFGSPLKNSNTEFFDLSRLSPIVQPGTASEVVRKRRACTHIRLQTDDIKRWIGWGNKRESAMFAFGITKPMPVLLGQCLRSDY